MKKILPTFIEKSASEIKNSNISDFLYVPTDQNPADVVSRGSDMNTLIEQNWWNGPSWLSGTNKWPEQRLYSEKDNKLFDDTINNFFIEEEKILFLASYIQFRHPDSNLIDTPFNIDPTKFSSLDRLLRRTVTCSKALSKFLRPRNTKWNYKDIDFNDALCFWIRWDQER